MHRKQFKRESLRRAHASGVSIARVVIAASILAPLAACSSPTDAGQSSTYTLASFAHRSLPADVGAVLVRGQDTIRTATCHVLVTSGDLALQKNALSQFNLVYRMSNSCTGAPVDSMPLDGTYTAHGNTLAFTVPAIVPPSYEFTGRLSGDSAIVDFPDEELVFLRR